MALGAGSGFCGLGLLRSASEPEEEDYACQDGEDAGGLGVVHTEKRARVETDDFDEEASNAGKNKVESEELAGGFWIAEPA